MPPLDHGVDCLIADATPIPLPFGEEYFLFPPAPLTPPDLPLPFSLFFFFLRERFC